MTKPTDHPALAALLSAAASMDRAEADAAQRAEEITMQIPKVQALLASHAELVAAVDWLLNQCAANGRYSAAAGLRLSQAVEAARRAGGAS